MIRFVLALAGVALIAGVATASAPMPAPNCEITGHIVSVTPGKMTAEFGMEQDITNVTLRIETRKPFRLQTVDAQAAAQGCAALDAPIEIETRTCSPLAAHWADTPVWGVLKGQCLDAILSMTGDTDTEAK